MWRLIDTWDSSEFRARRAEAAALLLETFLAGPVGLRMCLMPFSIY